MSNKKKFSIKDPQGVWWYSGRGQLVWSAAGKAKLSWGQFNRNPDCVWNPAHWKDHAEPFGWKIVEVDLVEKD
jgi:hypothetical protein